MCCAFLLPVGNITVGASTANTVSVGEIYKNSNFDKEKLAVLYKYLTGKDGATFSDVKNMVNGGTVDAAALRSNVNATGNGQSDIIVTIGGYDWTVVFLSAADRAGVKDNAQSGDVIMTLWLADSSQVQTTSYAAFVSDTAGNYPSSMYGTSKMRAVALNNGGKYAIDNLTLSSSPAAQTEDNDWAQFTMTEIGGNENVLANCIVSPYCLKWQETEQHTVNGSGYRTYNFNNEAYATNIPNMNTADMQSFEGYDTWKDDKLWLPSLTELGHASAVGGLWKTSLQQRAGSVRTLTRSGNDTRNSYVFALQTNGTLNLSGTPAVNTSQCSIRPAFHLNLSEAGGVGEPKPVTKEYRGSAYTLDEIVSGCGWYDSAIMKLDLISGNLKDVGTYKIKVTLTAENKIFNGTPGEGESDTVRFFIFTIDPVIITPPVGTVETTYNGETQSLSTLTSPPAWYDAAVFGNKSVIAMDEEFTDAGENTVTVTIADGGYKWSDYESNSSNSRTFNFNIKKKKLEVTFEGDCPVAKYDDAQLYERDKASGKKPKLITRYSKTGSLDNAVNSPDGLGNWYAIAALENDCNYYVDGMQTFTVTKRKIEYPILHAGSSESEIYNGGEHTFLFDGYNSTLMNFTVPDGADFDGTTLTVKNAGEYTVEYTLKDASECEWTGISELKVTVEKKNVVITADENNKSEWSKGGADEELKFRVSGTVSGESVKLTASYTKNGSGMAVIAVTDKGGGTQSVTIPKNYGMGSYVLTVKVADGENYVERSAAVHSFTITAEGLDLGENEIKWRINGTNYTVDGYKDGFIEIEYTGKPLTLTADISESSSAGELHIDGYGGSWDVAENTGEYTATVRIVSVNPAQYAFDKTYTLNIKIVPKTLSFENAVWQWQYAGESEWEELTDKNMPPYDGRAVNVRISPDYFTDLGLTGIDYTVTYQDGGDLTSKGDKSTKAIITVANENFTTGDGSGSCEVTKKWQITARALKYQWNGTQTVKAGDRQFEFAAITFEEDGDYSQYYEYYYTVDGEDGEFTKERLEEYLSEKWSETMTITGKVYVRMTGVSEDFVIRESFRSFSTGASKTALAVAVTTNETSVYGDVGFAFTVKRGEADERARTKVTVNGKEFDGNDVKAITDYINTLDVGNYTVAVSVKDENSYMLTGDYSYSLTISPAELKVKWNSKGTLESDGNSGYKGSLDGLFDYTYKDADGNEVEKPERGKTYTVVATLKDSVKKNFTMSDDMSLLISTPFEFTMDDGGNFFKDNLAIIIGVALGLLLLLVLILFFVLRRRRADDYYDDEYDYDDEDEDDYDDDDEDDEDY